MSLMQTQYERYEWQERLGASVFATTWTARDRHSDQQVIIKALDLGQLDSWKNLELFQREARVLSQLQHAAIPHLLEAFEHENNSQQGFYLVLEKIPGSNLKQIFETGWRPNEAEARELARQVLEILSYLQTFSPPIVHRDLKPSNLMRDPQGKIWLIDFGAVQELLKPKGASTVVGTYGYMAPEQFAGQAVPASDLYSLGATLVHLLTGTPPAELPQQRLKLAFADRFEASQAFKSWLGKLLEPSLQQRFKSADQALHHLLTGSTEAQASDIAHPETAAVPKSRIDSLPRIAPENLPLSDLLTITPQKYGMEISLPNQKFELAGLLINHGIIHLLCFAAPPLMYYILLLWYVPLIPPNPAHQVMVAYVLIYLLCAVPLTNISIRHKLEAFGKHRRNCFEINLFMLKYGEFFLPTHLLREAKYLPSKLGLAYGGLLVLSWEAPVTRKYHEWLIQGDPHPHLQAETGLDSMHLQLGLKDTEYTELVQLLMTFLYTQAPAISRARHNRTQQALNRLKPPPDSKLQLDKSEKGLTISWDLGKLQLQPEGLSFVNAQNQEVWKLAWSKLKRFHHAKFARDHDAARIDRLSAQYNQTESIQIYQLHGSQSIGQYYEVAWLHDLLSRFLA